MGAARAASRPNLDRARIVRAAVEVADAEGIDAVTVRRLAARLDVHFSSLYTHVASKEAILDGVLERLIAEAKFPAAYPDWATWVRTFATALRALARAHPGAFGVFTRRPAGGPLGTQQAEAALTAFVAGGFSLAAASAAVRGASLALLGLALNENPSARFEAPDSTHLSADRFPYVVEASALDDDTTSVWTMVVESLIAGMVSRR